MQGKLNIYTRRIWTVYKGEKVITRALVVEVPTQHREIITKVLVTKKDHFYDTVEYISFSRIDDGFYNETMMNIFTTHNRYLQNMEKKTIYGATNVQKDLTMNNDTVITFREWLEQFIFDDTRFVEACEVG